MNRAPTANAGTDLAATAGQALALNAGASTDPDGDALQYAWNIVAGSGGGLTRPDQANASFLAALPGTYILEVTVRDAGNLSSSDILVIDVRPPRSATGVTLESLANSWFEGSSGTVAVYLPQAAGAGGAQVTLNSSDSTIAQAPDSILVPEGESVAAFHVEGLAAGVASITAAAPGLDPASLVATVQPRLLTLSAASGSRGLVAGQATTLTVRLRDAAPAGGARVSLGLSDATRSSLSAAHVDFAAGATEGRVTFTGSAPGAVAVNATLESGGGGEPLRLMVIPPGVVADRSSGDLIDAALRAGTITAEQGVVYGIQAAFGAPELPAQFRGNDIGRLDSQAGRLANLRIESLSDASQQAIGKYLFPPIYAESWGAIVTPSQHKALRTRPQAVDVTCFDRLRGMPRQDTLPHWRFIRTGVFKVWYPTVLGPDVAQFNWYTAQENEQAARNVVASIQASFARLSAVLGDVLRDGGVACNGGDDAIDIYVTRIGFGESAQVMPYLPGECARPGWMWVAPDKVSTPEDARNLIGHELVHLFQLRYARPNCDDWRYGILDEATATWAFDFLRPADNYEHEFLHGDGAYFDGARGDWRASPLESGGGSVRNCNGYCDYLFFEWLSRRYTPNAIRSVLDATASVNAQQAFETGLGGIGGGLEQLWPRFALFQWNDHAAHVHDELQGWEGVSAASIRHGVVPSISHFITGTLDGQPRRDLSDAVFSKLRSIRDGELPPMTTNYLHLRFSDPTVARVRFRHEASTLRGQWPRLKVQAIEKINGQWRAAEDWSGETEKSYCRDKRDERIEELVLVYSNSHAGTEPFLHEGPTVVQLYTQDEVMPELVISNAACMPWHGTTSVTQRSSIGGVTRYTANVEYKLLVLEGEDPEEIARLPMQTFVPASGIATAEKNWPDEGGCVQSTPLVSGSIGELDGYLAIDFDRRLATAVGISTLPGATHRLECPGAEPIVSTGPAPSSWFSLGLTGQPLGEDGRTLRGSFVDSNSTTGVTTTYEWNLSAEREE